MGNTGLPCRRICLRLSGHPDHRFSFVPLFRGANIEASHALRTAAAYLQAEAVAFSRSSPRWRCRHGLLPVAAIEKVRAQLSEVDIIKAPRIHIDFVRIRSR